MNVAAPIASAAPRFRWLPLLAVGLALVVLGGALAWAALDLRERIQSQIVQGDAEILDAVTLMQHLNDQAEGRTLATLEDPGEQFQLALKVSKLRNVLGVRLYAADGKFVNAFPAYITDAALPASALEALQQLHPASLFSARARMDEQDMLAETNSPTAALLFVEVPLRTAGQPRLAGVIQFIMDGGSIARQYAALDRNLALKFAAIFLMGGSILIAVLVFALNRVQRANQKLAERTKNLLQANRELALAARTSAVGAVASHLIHGLKNPLSGLRHFVHAHNSAVPDDSDWQAARRTTQRMEELINRVVRVLQEQQSGVEYELSLAETVNLLLQKAKPLADTADVRLAQGILAEGRFSNHEADLILLILENLLQNGIEATPPGGQVTLTVERDAEAFIFEVRDQGHGLPPGMESQLFMPCNSAKKGGGGIGLAICRQLAISLNATLKLAASNASGCIFQLRFKQQPQEPNPKTPLQRTTFHIE